MNSTRTREDDATIKGLATIKHGSQKDRERDRETRSPRDWYVSEHEIAKKLQEGMIA